MTLVDANILIDLFTDDPSWVEWSGRALSQSAAISSGSMKMLSTESRRGRAALASDSVPHQSFAKAARYEEERRESFLGGCFGVLEYGRFAGIEIAARFLYNFLCTSGTTNVEEK